MRPRNSARAYVGAGPDEALSSKAINVEPQSILQADSFAWSWHNVPPIGQAFHKTLPLQSAGRASMFSNFDSTS